MRDDTAIADTQTGDSEAREVRSKKDLDLECEEGFRIILDSIRDGVIRVDEFRRVVLMNRVAEEMTGWRLDTTNENPCKTFSGFILRILTPTIRLKRYY